MAYGDIAYESHNSSTDPAMVSIAVSLDTSIWSRRKRQIVTRCITTGILNAGERTCNVVADLMASHGIHYASRRGWGDADSVHIRIDSIKPDMFSDLKAVVDGRLKIKRATGIPLGYQEKNYLDSIERRAGGGKEYPSGYFDDSILVHNSIPLNEYLIDDGVYQRGLKAKLCAAINAGEIVECIYTPPTT